MSSWAGTPDRTTRLDRPGPDAALISDMATTYDETPGPADHLPAAGGTPAPCDELCWATGAHTTGCCLSRATTEVGLCDYHYRMLAGTDD
jgi:hypothetical protein